MGVFASAPIEKTNAPQTNSFPIPFPSIMAYWIISTAAPEAKPVLFS